MAKNEVKQGTADFDWEALALDGYTQAQRSELSQKYEDTLSTIIEKEVIKGTVVALNKKEVVVNQEGRPPIQIHQRLIHLSYDT